MKKFVCAILIIFMMLTLTSCDMLNDIMMSIETEVAENNVDDNIVEDALSTDESKNLDANKPAEEDPDDSYDEPQPEETFSEKQTETMRPDDQNNSDVFEHDCEIMGHRIAWIIDGYADQNETGRAHGACRECGYESEKLLAASQTLKYESNGDGTCSVIGYKDDGKDEIVVPLTYNGERVTVIRSAAFESLREIKEIFLPKGLEEIGSSAFSWCETMTFVNIPDSVRSIGESAFWYCFEITELSIPDKIEYIGASAFGCTGITSLEVSEANPNYHVDGNCLIETNSKTLIAGFGDSVIPSDESVEYIGNGAFAGCEELTEITIPKSVKSIGPHAFYCCGNMTSITFEEGLEIIEYNAFNACHSLTKLVLPKSLNKLADSAFTWCSGIEEIYLSKGIAGIGSGAFNQCSSLNTIYYEGSASEWRTVIKGTDWDSNAGDYIIEYNYS